MGEKVDSHVLLLSFEPAHGALRPTLLVTHGYKVGFKAAHVPPPLPYQPRKLGARGHQLGQLALEVVEHLQGKGGGARMRLLMA